MKVVLALLVVLVSGEGHAVAQDRLAPAGPTSERGARNPAFLHASALPGTARNGSHPVRLEWEQVGARQYVLQGQSLDPASWAIRKRELCVTPRNATQWDDRMVAIEISAEAGTHAWSVVAVFNGRTMGDFGNPTRVRFAIQ